MSKVNQDTSLSYNSTASTSRADSISETEVNKVKNYLKDQFKSRIFLGRYLERRLCDSRIGYRDVVLLSPAESDLKRDLVEASLKLKAVLPNSWIGITDLQPSGLCIWTEIDNQHFGPFWFQIKSVKFREDEVIITVKCIRQITDSFLEIEPILTGRQRSKNITQCESSDSNDSTEVLSETFSEIKETLKSALSIRNVKEFVSFLCAFVIAVFTGTNAFINFLGNFVLALLREVSFFVKSSTPLFLGILDFCSKIIGGFYILIAMMFKPSNPVPTNTRSIAYYEHKKRRSYRPYDDYPTDYSID